jgi:outer membrane protein OmpA-like peptidoglycan-associated protein
VINRWTFYRDFQFDPNQAALRASDTNQVSDIALYLKSNPSLKVGIDGSMEPRNQGLTDQRVSTVSEALIKAGVTKSRIQTGTFDGSKLAHDGRVTVLVRTTN